MALTLTAALLAGLLSSLVRLPPLVGFLAAGFALNAAGVEAPSGLGVIADLGVTLLLFGIGLKLNLRALVRREVWVTATAHLGATAVATASFLALLAALGVGLVAGADWHTFLLIGFALSFSSTVFAVTLLEERGGQASLSGRTAIGILVVQDLLAVVYLAAAHGRAPSPWAIALILLIPASLLVVRCSGGSATPSWGRCSGWSPLSCPVTPSSRQSASRVTSAHWWSASCWRRTPVRQT